MSFLSLSLLLHPLSLSFLSLSRSLSLSLSRSLSLHILIFYVWSTQCGVSVWGIGGEQRYHEDGRPSKMGTSSYFATSVAHIVTLTEMSKVFFFYKMYRTSNFNVSITWEKRYMIMFFACIVLYNFLWVKISKLVNHLLLFIYFDWDDRILRVMLVTSLLHLYILNCSERT